ncbi:MAG: hypothetical protein JSR31_16220 [Nitrospira sp.]|nr:hypothetical protein [Nitrospira sp.]
MGCSLVSGVVVAVSAYSVLQWGALSLLQYFGISDAAQGAASFLLLFVFLVCALGGSVIGLFLYPLVLRAVLSPIEYWEWMDGEQKISVPGLSHILERWSVFVYGPKENKDMGH